MAEKESSKKSENKDQDAKLLDDVGQGPGCLGKTIKSFVLVLVIAAVVLLVVSLQKVQAWEVGLRYWNVPVPVLAKRGEVDVLKPGYNVIVPYLHQFNKYDCRVQRFEMARSYPGMEDPDRGPLKVRTSKDQDEIDVYVTILYRVDREQLIANVKETGSTGLREKYSNDRDIREIGISGQTPQILQAKLGEIMTANQFYSMTAEKRVMIRKRTRALEELVASYQEAAQAIEKLEKEMADAEAEPGEDAKAEPSEDAKAEPGEDVKAELEKWKTKLQALEKKAAGMKVRMENIPGGLSRMEALALELKKLQESYPAPRYLLDRAGQVNKATEEMNQFFKPRGIEIVSVLIWDFQFKDEIEASIISKVIADEKVEMEMALKEAADARAEWQKKVAEANAAAEAELARGQARATEIDAEAQRYYSERESVGNRLVLTAEADGKGRISQALAGPGGQVYLGLQYAEVLGGIELIILPAGGPDGLNPLDINNTVDTIRTNGMGGGK